MSKLLTIMAWYVSCNVSQCALLLIQLGCFLSQTVLQCCTDPTREVIAALIQAGFDLNARDATGKVKLLALFSSPLLCGLVLLSHFIVVVFVQRLLCIAPRLLSWLLCFWRPSR